jgi:hypothetical protein
MGCFLSTYFRSPEPWTASCWNSADKGLIVCKPFAEDDHPFGRDFAFANILGMIPAPHLDHHHDLAKLAIDGYLPRAKDVIAKGGD